MRLRPYFANRSLIASTRRAWVVRPCCTASNLNCFAASGTTCAAINWCPCLPFPFTTALVAADPSRGTAAGGALTSCCSELNVKGVRLLISVCLIHVFVFVYLLVCVFATAVFSPTKRIACSPPWQRGLGDRILVPS